MPCGKKVMKIRNIFSGAAATEVMLPPQRPNKLCYQTNSVILSEGVVRTANDAKVEGSLPCERTQAASGNSRNLIPHHELVV